MTKDENAKLFRLLHGLYRNAKDITEDVELAYYIALKPYEYLEVREAVLSLAQRARFFPMWLTLWSCCQIALRKEKRHTSPTNTKATLCLWRGCGRYWRRMCNGRRISCADCVPVLPPL